MKQDEIQKIILKLIPTFLKAGDVSIDLFNKKLKINTKDDNTPVTNGDLAVNEMIIEKLKTISPNIEIVSEENIGDVVTKERKDLWLIDPIDGTNSYINGGDEYTLNAGLVINKKAVAGIIYAPKKNRLFFSYGANNAYEIKNNKKIKIDCQKLNDKTIALSNSSSPSDKIMSILDNYKVVKFKSMRSSLKFCLIANGEFDLYAANPRAKEWDIAAGHAIAENAGAIVSTHNNKPIRYGKSDFSNPSLLVRKKDLQC